MPILTILTAICFFNRSNKLKKTKDIEKYVWGYPKRIKDRDGYIKLYSKIYFSDGLILTVLGVFSILNNYYFDLSIEVLLILFCVVFILALIESVVIEKKIKKFI